MTPKDIHTTYKHVLLFLSQNKLKDAFEKTEILANELQLPSYKESLVNMQTNYRYMLQYFMDGVSDPDRSLVYNKLIAKIFVLVECLRDELLTRDSSNFEFSQKRYFPHTPQFTPEQLRESLNRKHRKAEIEKIMPENRAAIAQIDQDFESAVKFLFNCFWLTPSYTSSSISAMYAELLSSDYPESVPKSMLVSGVTLNLWRAFDEQKMLLLIDACQNEDLHVRQRALVGLCFVLAKYNRFLSYFPVIRNRLILLVDDPSITNSLQNIIIQIIATAETEKISKKLQEEIFPELLKLRSMTNKEITLESLLSTDEWGEANPEWQEIIENSAISEKFQELAEMEMGGADVYMSTFSMLKSFPFFADFSNWFLPFDTAHTAINGLFQADSKSLVSVFSTSNAMCNSDKYSFCLSISQMPDMQRDMLKNSFGEAAEQLEEAQKEESLYSPQTQIKTIAKHYIQDLFRFFKLHPQRTDFTDMFSTSLIMHKTYLFDLLVADNDLKLNIAEYYFSKKLYRQALELFEELEKEGETTAVLYQKIGYSYQQTSQLFKALNAYKKADLIQPDDFWTNRKIAFCYKLTGDAENALKVYRHAHFIFPDNLSVQLQIVDCLYDLKRYEEALNILLDIHKGNSNNLSVLRAIIRGALFAKNPAQAGYFTALLLEKKDLTARDYITSGHVAWLTHKNIDAQNQYNHALALLGNDWESFSKLFDKTLELLIVNEISEQEIALVLDAIKYGRF